MYNTRAPPWITDLDLRDVSVVYYSRWWIQFERAGAAVIEGGFGVGGFGDHVIIRLQQPMGTRVGL